MHMRNMRKKILALVATLATSASLFASVAFAAINANDPENIVRQQYPDATIYRVKTDHEDGHNIFEVKFRTGEFFDSEMEIDADTGEILKIDLDR